MKLEHDARRLLIFFFYDRDGIVDDYIPYMLRDMQQNVAEICVVCNGLLTDEGKNRFLEFTDHIIARENKGFDVWAYKTGLESYGWEKLKEFDEIVMMNHTMMGPVYPFAEMFSSMDDRDLDFWGITQFYKTEDDPFGTMPDGYIPDHIQSHFIAARSSLFNSDIYHKYWDEMPMITGYLDSVSRHEAYFTKYFEQAGYRWQVYADAEDFRTLSHQPAVGMAKRVIAEKRCPIFKRRSFMQDYNVILNESTGQEAYELYRYLKEHTDYDMNLLWDNLLRLENQADLKKNFQWNYILSSDTAKPAPKLKERRIALVMHIHFIDLVEECAQYAEAMPEWADIYVTTNTEEKKAAIEARFSQIPCGRLDVRMVPNKGRDVGPFLVEFRDYLEQYDYVCHVHDKKAGQTTPGTIGTSFAYKCFENVLKSKEYVNNVLTVFEENERAGLLTPPPPNHADYYITLGLEWGMNYDVTKQLAEELGIHVSIKQDKEPIAPLGSFFWARAEALKPLFAKKWTYEDFPEEPIADDGTLLHAIERIYPFSAQSMGLYPGWILCDTGAAMEVTNLNHMVRELNKIIFFKGNDAGKYSDTLGNLSRSYDCAREDKTVYHAAGFADAKLYYGNSMCGFCEENTRVAEPAVCSSDGDAPDENIYEYPLYGQMISDIRFDPCEFGLISMRSCNIRIEDVQGAVTELDMHMAEHNGIDIDGNIVFLEDDPRLNFHLNKDIVAAKITCTDVIDRRIPDEIRQAIRRNCQPRRGLRRLLR